MHENLDSAVKTRNGILVRFHLDSQICVRLQTTFTHGWNFIWQELMEKEPFPPLFFLFAMWLWPWILRSRNGYQSVKESYHHALFECISLTVSEKANGKRFVVVANSRKELPYTNYRRQLSRYTPRAPPERRVYLPLERGPVKCTPFDRGDRETCTQCQIFRYIAIWRVVINISHIVFSAPFIETKHWTLHGLVT